MPLNKEETKFITKWDQVKARGQWRYTLTRGLFWGLFVSVFSYLLQSWDALADRNTTALADGFVSSDFPVRLFIYTSVGIGIHAYHWNENTKRYNQLKNLKKKARALATSGKN